jgi:hypothetical protein
MAMKRWDYKTVVLTGGFMGRHKEELKRADLETEFDALGRDGWELSWSCERPTFAVFVGLGTAYAMTGRSR